MSSFDHGLFLEALTTTFRVYLAGRYEQPGLRLDSDSKLRVFIPDLHWISRERWEKYPAYRFESFREFPALVRVLKEIENLEAFQTGDRLDFWRMREPSEKSAAEIYDEILRDPDIRDLNQSLIDLGTTFVHGNHDALVAGLAGDSGTRPRDRATPAAGIFVTHGHIWDEIEQLPETLKWGPVYRAQTHHFGTYGIGPFVADPQEAVSRELLFRKGSRLDRGTPIVLPSRTGAAPVDSEDDVLGIANAFVPIDRFDDGHATGINDFQKTSGIVAFGDKVRAAARDKERDSSLFVLAHTHWPRILVDSHPHGGPLVTLDCGAWIESCTIRKEEPQPSRQIGVQVGNDVRVYQLALRS